MIRKSNRRRSRGQRQFRQLTGTGATLVNSALRAAEIGLASAQTIGIRTAMLQQAAGDPVALADPEFVLMGREKIEAAVASADAMRSDLLSIATAWTGWLWNQHQLSATAVVDLAGCRSPDAVARVQMRYVETSLAQSAELASKLTRSLLAATYAGMAPVHRAASANARRLSRTRNGTASAPGRTGQPTAGS